MHFNAIPVMGFGRGSTELPVRWRAAFAWNTTKRQGRGRKQ